MNINEVWESEATMAEAYKELMSLSEFDRTLDAAKLTLKLMSKLVSPHPTFHDIRAWVLQNVPDFNIASQILLNCQFGQVKFDVDALEKLVLVYQSDEWKESPFEKKAKFKVVDESEATTHYNLALACHRNLNILKKSIRVNSYRLSPIGSTPALADANNFSSLSLAGIDKYCKNATVHLVNHEAVAKHIHLRQDDSGAYLADGLEFPIVSKSGGDIVTRSIVARWLVVEIMKGSEAPFVVPKYDSFLVVGAVPAELSPFLS